MKVSFVKAGERQSSQPRPQYYTVVFTSENVWIPSFFFLLFSLFLEAAAASQLRPTEVKINYLNTEI